MHKLMRAALMALVLSLPYPPAQAHAQQQPATLPAQRARPPASRTPAPAPPRAQPRQPAPARAPAARQAPARPAAAPVRADSGARAQATALAPSGETWADISAERANTGAPRLPVGRGHSGPSVLRVQVMLSRSHFSAGMLDGRWGRNTQTAVMWYQAREGLPATGTVDSVTYARLMGTAGGAPIVRAHTLVADDVRGPFVDIPDDIYAQARLSCSCFESLTEKLTEQFHASADLLRKLNPGVKLDSVVVGDTLYVPATRAMDAPAPGLVRQIVVSGSGSYVQALDSAGAVLYHFAATLGSSYDPSPDGDFMVKSIHENPWWNYQPAILAHVPDDEPSAMIPPGPNSSVGRVWMALSAPHYGIHGTKSPETIGYAQSAGCVRLTNWDVLFLSKRVPPGTPVAFRDTRGGPAQGTASPATRPAQLPAADSAAAPDSARPAVPRPTATQPARDTARPATPRPTTTQPAARDTARPATPRPATTQPAARDTARPATPRPTTTQPAARDTARPATPRPAATQPAVRDTARPAAPRPAATQPAARDSARPATPRPRI